MGPQEAALSQPCTSQRATEARPAPPPHAHQQAGVTHLGWALTVKVLLPCCFSRLTSTSLRFWLSCRGDSNQVVGLWSHPTASLSPTPSCLSPTDPSPAPRPYLKQALLASSVGAGSQHTKPRQPRGEMEEAATLLTVTVSGDHLFFPFYL